MTILQLIYYEVNYLYIYQFKFKNNPYYEILRSVSDYTSLYNTHVYTER